MGAVVGDGIVYVPCGILPPLVANVHSPVIQMWILLLHIEFGTLAGGIE